MTMLLAKSYIYLASLALAPKLRYVWCCASLLDLRISRDTFVALF